MCKQTINNTRVHCSVFSSKSYYVIRAFCLPIFFAALKLLLAARTVRCKYTYLLLILHYRKIKNRVLTRSWKITCRYTRFFFRYFEFLAYTRQDVPAYIIPMGRNRLCYFRPIIPWVRVGGGSRTHLFRFGEGRVLGEVARKKKWANAVI